MIYNLGNTEKQFFWKKYSKVSECEISKIHKVLFK